MPNTSFAARALPALALLALAGLLLFRLADFGIWDPWELEVAESARALLKTTSSPGELAAGKGPVWLTSAGFRLFGVHEWAGRLPVALAGLLALAVTLGLGGRLTDIRTGVYAAVVAATMPLFVFNARPMAGAAPEVLAQTALGLTGAQALLGRARPASRRLWLLACLSLVPLGAWLSGALVGPLPAMLALGAVVLFTDVGRSGERRAVAAILLATAAGLAAATVVAVLGDHTEGTLWTGGAPRAVKPPSHDAVLARVFHAAAPWSALLPLSLGMSAGGMAATGAVRGGEPPHPAAVDTTTAGDAAELRLFLFSWLGFGYAAHTVFLSRYGHGSTFLPICALALLVALFLRDLEDNPKPRVFAAIATALLAGLLIRDYAQYPTAPIEGLSLRGFEVPEAFNPKGLWAGALGVFAAVTLLCLAVGNQRPTLDLAAPYRLIKGQWRRGPGFRVWLCVLALALLALLSVGTLAWVAPKVLGMNVLGTKVMRRLTFVPLLIPAAVAAAQLSWWGTGRLGCLRVPAILLASLPTGAYAAQGFLPSLAEQLSPREVYVAFNELSEPGATLAEFGVSRRAAAYYARGDIVETQSIPALVEHLAADGHRWAVFPADKLAKVDRRFRKQTGRHLFVADARSRHVLLASNRDLSGRRNQNKLARRVLSSPPEIEHPLHARFSDRVELLGYRLELPHRGFVGAGEAFHITWYFRALKRVRKDHKVFVHIDRGGQRINGDHVPVDGNYPIRMWEPGDVLVDRHRLEATPQQRAGKYKIYMGFFAGEERLPVTEGPQDGKDRVEVGTLDIR